MMLQMLMGMAAGLRILTLGNHVGANSGPAPSGSVSSSDPTSMTTENQIWSIVTFLWEHVSTSSGSTPGINSSAIFSPSWSSTVSEGTPSISTWRLTITDSGGQVADKTCTVSLTWTNSS
jgi:hypothetical protein